MFKNFLLVSAALLVVSCDKGFTNKEPTGWNAGPVIDGRNYSNINGNPLPITGEPPTFIIPQAPGSAHYITRAAETLTDKTGIVLRYRVDIPEGVKLAPKKGAEDSPTIITPYFQRKDDNWTGKGEHEAYRWYATFASKMPIEAGEHEIVAPFSSNWTAVETSSRESNPQGFAEALANPDRIGFVLGGGDGYGHGVYSIGGNATITILAFEVK